VGWAELAAKQTGTERNIVREPYFTGEELEAAVAIVNEARVATADQKVEPRPFKLPSDEAADDEAKVVVEDAAVDESDEANDAEADAKADAGESTSVDSTQAAVATAQ
jgi:hypothetical protein